MALLTVENLTFTYEGGDIPVIKAVNIAIEEGEFVVIAGISGSGKTTLLHHMKRQLTPNGKSTGHCYYEQRLLSELSSNEEASAIGIITQRPYEQIVTETVWHELAFGLENLGYPTLSIRQKVAEIANYLGISQLFHQKIENLSGGQQQLVNLASVLITMPKILLVDEPTSQLDPVTSTAFLKKLHQINEDLGITIIMVEHRLDTLLPLIDRLIIMDNGEIISDTKPRQLDSKLHIHPMFLAMPSVMQLAVKLGATENYPLTVKEGKTYIKKCPHLTILPRTIPIKVKPLLTLKEISFRYQRQQLDIIEEADFTIYEDEIVAIIGANGAGKSTLLKIIAGHYKVYKGKYFYQNKKVKTYKDLPQIAYLPQQPLALFTKNTLQEEYHEIKLLYDLEIAYLTEIVQQFDLASLLDRHPRDLSGGELQRAALAKLVLIKPKVLLVDEPTKGIDAYMKQWIAKYFLQLQQQGVTIVIVTHDLDFVAEVATRCGMLFDRKIIAINTPHAFFQQNKFYTTAINRIIPKSISVNEIIPLS